eukprot:scaffold264848_cov17-Prasinocladus_malaysianus.AAC.1
MGRDSIIATHMRDERYAHKAYIYIVGEKPVVFKRRGSWQAQNLLRSSTTGNAQCSQLTWV